MAFTKLIREYKDALYEGNSQKDIYYNEDFLKKRYACIEYIEKNSTVLQLNSDEKYKKLEDDIIKWQYYAVIFEDEKLLEEWQRQHELYKNITIYGIPNIVFSRQFSDCYDKLTITKMVGDDLRIKS